MEKNVKKSKNRPSVQPIRNPEDIKRIRSILQERPRDLLLFDLATQTGFTMKEILGLKVEDLLGVNEGDKIPNPRSRNGRLGSIMTERVYQTYHQYLKNVGLKPGDYLFKSKKGQQPLNLSSVSTMIKGWFEAANISGNYGAISLRKTWEYSLNNKNNPVTPPEKINSMEFLSPIETLTVQEIVFKKLSEAIISGKISPGTRLVTTEIAKAFKVSQAPVRVALNWLEAKGLITSQKKKASVVRKLSIKELKEIMHIRLILETSAVELSCKVCTDETLRLSESIIHLAEKAYTWEEYDQLNTQFHQTLYRDAQMPLLLQLISDMCDRVSPYVILHYSNRGTQGTDSDFRSPSEHSYHRGMLEGMRRKDPDETRKYLELDLGKRTASLEEILKQRESGYVETESNDLAFSFKI